MTEEKKEPIPDSKEVVAEESSAQEGAPPAEHKKSSKKSSAELSAAREQIQHLQQEGQSKDQEITRLNDLYLRAHAEMENLKKRTAKEKEEFAKYAQESLIISLLPVVDNLERALEAAKNHQGLTDPSALEAGVALILKQFLETLEKAGVKPILAQGEPFNPHFHHAVMQVETNDAPEGTVLEVLQKGYLLKDRLLRPAMVKVSTSPKS